MTQDLEDLYLFGFSERAGKYLLRLLPIIKTQLNRGKKIGVVFIHDGVIGTTTRGKIPKSISEILGLNLTLFVLTPDLKARGIDSNTIDAKITGIGYEELADLLDSTPKIISWM